MSWITSTPTRRELRAMRRTRLGRMWFWIWYGN